MKRLLIISPYFPPANTADMQRIRMSLSYFKKFDWEPEVVVVQEDYLDVVQDPLLLQSIPAEVKIHKIKALDKKWTSKFGLGSVALRAMWFYKIEVNKLLQKNKFDLIYFSTTEFPLCILGPYWKKKFGIPYIIDMQDPWHTDYYKNLPKIEQPKKYWFSYRLNKYLEPIAMKKADGLISVSASYIDTLKKRYLQLKEKPSAVITFGAFDIDFEIAKKNDKALNLVFDTKKNHINLVYIGRGGNDMKPALNTLIGAFKKGLAAQPQLFCNIQMHFIGTSYAPKGTGVPTIVPEAKVANIDTYLTEYTDRIGFYQSIKNLQNADGLIIIGSNQAAYNASKIYPYILAKRPLLAVLHQDSNAAKIIKDCAAGHLINIDEPADKAFETMLSYLQSVYKQIPPTTNWQQFEHYTAYYMTKRQVELFNKVV